MNPRRKGSKQRAGGKRTRRRPLRGGAREPRIEILYEDRSLVVVNKPAGMPTVSPRHLGHTSAWSALRKILAAREPASGSAAGHEPESGHGGVPGRGDAARSLPGGRVALRHRAVRRGGRPGAVPPVELYVIHRLDQPASGLLVFARTERARAGLKDLLAKRQMERRYAAIVYGSMPSREGEIRSRLVETDHPKHKVRRLRRNDPDSVRALSREAVTRYRVLGIASGMTALGLELETGRKHQIRVQLAGMGHPVVGDRLYAARGAAKAKLSAGTRSRTGEPGGTPRARGEHSPEGGEGGPHRVAPPARLLLHAWTLRFQHPVTRRKMEFVAPPGADFDAAVPEAFGGADKHPPPERPGRG